MDGFSLHHFSKKLFTFKETSPTHSFSFFLKQFIISTSFSYRFWHVFLFSFFHIFNLEFRFIFFSFLLLSRLSLVASQLIFFFVVFLGSIINRWHLSLVRYFYFLRTFKKNFFLHHFADFFFFFSLKRFSRAQ